MCLSFPDGNYTSQGLIDKINQVVAPNYDNGSLRNVNDIFSYVISNLLNNVIKINPAFSNIVS